MTKKDYRNPDIDWFDKDTSNAFSLPLKNNYTKTNMTINFGNDEYDKLHSSHFVFNSPKSVLNYDTFSIKPDPKDVQSLKTLKTSLKNTKKKPLTKKNTTKIKSLKTKIAKKEKNLNKTTTAKRYVIYPSNKQKEWIFNIFDECTSVYNKCVELHTLDNTFFNKGYMKTKIEIFEILYDTDKMAAYDILTDEVKTFCANLKSCRTNLEEENIKHYELKFKKRHRLTHSISIPKTAIKINIRGGSIYHRYLGKMKGLEHLGDIEIIDDCRIIYTRDKDRFELVVPIHTKRKIIKNREKVVALDPGEKIFMSYFSEKEFGYLGKDMRDIFLEKQEEIKKWQKILAEKKNKRGKKISNPKKIKKIIRNKYRKMKNIVKELHNKIALFLCKNYERILIPKFETQKMISNEELTDEVQYSLNMLSHYKFKQHLINKGNEYGCLVVEVTEEDTSITCTKCGKKSNKYTDRIKTCKECKYKINRDINGARNILIRNIGALIKDIENALL